LLSEINILNLILNSGIVAKAVIIILLVFSILSWALIAERWRYFRRAQIDSRRFLGSFENQSDFEVVNSMASKWHHSPAAIVFHQIYKKHHGIFSSYVDKSIIDKAILETIFRDLGLAANRELNQLEQRLPALATAGSVCPFLGLFGTVWGVMTAFLDISTQGSTNIVVVAPGIAEALITTIAGLAVAIPAMVAYNYFVQKSRVFGLEMEDMAITIINTLQLRGRNEHI